jgi:hypothetical protein
MGDAVAHLARADHANLLDSHRHLAFSGAFSGSFKQTCCSQNSLIQKLARLLITTTAIGRQIMRSLKSRPGLIAARGAHLTHWTHFISNVFKIPATNHPTDGYPAG